MKFKMRRVHYMPKNLKSGILYVSEEFNIAIHLCACGCGSKVKTPLGVTDWSLEKTKAGPSLRPSIGNWQQACQSHYWITGGKVVWAEKWTAEDIAARRCNEEESWCTSYKALERRLGSVVRGLWRRFTGLFGYRFF